MSKAKIDINKHISELLYSYDCVILPDFGGFISNYKPASLSDDGKYIIPPSKAISFNKNLNNNDGLLINFIAERNNIDYNKSKQYVANFVSNLFLKLDNNNKYIFDKIGEVVFDKSMNLIFEPNTTDNYLSDSFGLSAINFPVLDASVKKSIEEKGGFKKILFSSTAKKVYLVIPIIILLSVVSVKTNLLNKFSLNTSSITSIETGISNEKKLENIVERKIDSMTKKENALFYKEPEFVVPKHYDSLVIQIMESEANKNLITENTKLEEIKDAKLIEVEKELPKKEKLEKDNKVIKKEFVKGEFILVSGSYKSKKRANSRINKLKKQGFFSEIIKYKGGYRISVASYNDKAFAKKESKRFKKQGVKCWVTSR